MLFTKKIKKENYDKENMRPVIKVSICTGEQVAGFKDINTGKFSEVMLITNPEDKRIFMERYDIPENEIMKEW